MEEIKDFFKKCIKGEISEALKLTENKINPSISKFVVYLRELQKWNKAYNLTSITDEREIIVKHFIDSLLYLYYIPEKPLKLADIGSGAGFPGIPIAAVRPYLQIKLIEPSWKKSAFLKHIIRKLELKNVEVIQSKAQQIDEKFDIVISRALWSIKDFIENCRHLLKEKGYFIISKALKIKEELSNLPSGFNAEIKEFILPEVNTSSDRAKRAIIKLCES